MAPNIQKEEFNRSKSEWPEGPETKKKMGPQLAYKILIKYQHTNPYIQLLKVAVYTVRYFANIW